MKQSASSKIRVGSLFAVVVVSLTAVLAWNIWAAPLHTPRGTPHAWLNSYNLVTDDDDEDGDGWSTWEEFCIGGNPTNADDFSVSTFMVGPATNVRISWASSSSGSTEPYWLRFTTNLAMDVSEWPVIGVSPRTPPSNIWESTGFDTMGFLCVQATYTYSPGVTLSVSASPISEPSGSALVTATLSDLYFQPVLVRLSFSGTAQRGADYSVSSTNILILPGQDQRSITVQVLDDDEPESSESVVVSVLDIVNGHEVGDQTTSLAIDSEDPEAPRIKIVKNASPDDPQDFGFTGDLGSFTLDDDEEATLPDTQWFGPLEPGAYAVTELEQTGWALTGLVVQDPDGGSSIDLENRTLTVDLDNGETVVATFGNTKLGSITVNKNAIPDSQTLFEFDGDLGAFSLVDDPEGPAGGTALFTNLLPGTYWIAESEAEGWNLIGIEAIDPDNESSTSLEQRAAWMDLDAGEDLVVTFVNHTGANHPPVAAAGGAYNVSEGSGFTLDASASSDPDELIGDAIVRYEWDLDDDGDFETMASPEDNPLLLINSNSMAVLGLDDGSWIHSVGLRVTDRWGATNLDWAEVVISNVPPTVTDLTVESSVDEGDTVTLSGTIMDPGPDTFWLQLDWGDGLYDYLDLSSPISGVTFDPTTRVFTAQHTYADDGTSPGNRTAWDLMLVGGTVTDDDGGSSTMSGDWSPMVANDDNDTGWSVTQQILAGEPLGQTFTAISDHPLSTISMYLSDMNASVAPNDDSVTFSLYAGTGSVARLLGTREYTGLSDGFSGWVSADFSSVTLKDGEVYTIVLENDTARWGRRACGNQYAGGTAIYAGMPSPTADALFRVQWQPKSASARAANEDNETGWSVTQQILAGEPLGQTFTALSGHRLSTVEMYVTDMNASVAPTDYSITFSLYEGTGTVGRLLGARAYTGLSDGFSGWVSADFSSVTLKDGEVYTIVLENDTARWGRRACGNQYAAGEALYAGLVSPTADALFRVQWQPEDVQPRQANDDNETGWSVTQQILAGNPIGQTFTAVSDNRLSTVGMYVSDMNASTAPTDDSLTFKLYEGTGTTGRLLGSRAHTGLSNGFSGLVSADFSSVTLKDGEVYTIVLENDTARWGRMACGNQYAGGTALYAGMPSPTADALFDVTWQPAGWAPMLANDDNDSGWSVTQQILSGAPIGQTFTALSDNPLSSISMYVDDMNASVAPNDYSLTFKLYEGIGTGGRLLGTREYTSLTDGYSGWIWASFSSVSLTEGQTYTVVLENDTARWGRKACGNQYAGGTALYFDSPSPTADALFRVEWQSDGAAPALIHDDNDSGWSVTQQILAGEPLGQTFTALADSRLSTISMYLADMNASVATDDYSVTFALYEGVGTGGRLLGTRAYDGLTDEFSGFVTVDFSAVTLRKGQTYTMTLLNDTARWGRYACGNQYAGGAALYADSISPSADAFFRVTWFPNPGRLAVIVNNVSPSFEAGEDENLIGGYLNRTIPFTDPGIDDAHTVTVDYGDGYGRQTINVEPGARQFSLNYGYTRPGSYPVSITVSDDDLGSRTDGFTAKFPED